MKFRKALFLFLALLLPIIIFLFLKSFGKNEFAVTPLFQDSVQAPSNCKSFSYKAPYVIADTILSKLHWNEKDSLTLLILDDSIPENQHKKMVQVERILSEFNGEKFQIVYIGEDTGNLKLFDQRASVVKFPRDIFFQIKNCIFLLDPTDNAIIIDPQKRIRGQYNLDDLDDADRLVMQEMNILFKRY